MGAATTASAATPPVCGPTGGAADFNGDGFADLAIGAKGDDGGNGAVTIMMGGTFGGLSGSNPGNQRWTLDSTGLAGSGQAGAGFGAAVATGDFNGDGRDDLAAGAPMMDIGTARDAGEVIEVLGSPSGLTATDSKVFEQNTGAVPDTAETGDKFGSALAAGDFNGDGYDDLAIGVPGENGNGGVIEVLFGSSIGLITTGSQLWRQGASGVTDFQEKDDQFGSALAAGRFDSDSYTDLMVGVPGEDGVAKDEGAILMLRGAYSGLTSTGNKEWTETTGGVPGDPENGDNLGYSVAAGDFNGDGHCDIAAGMPGESVGSVLVAGAVDVLYSGPSGPDPAHGPTKPQIWYRGHNGVQGSAQQDAQFGFSLAADDLNHDGAADLAIGAPSDYIIGLGVVGSVTVLYGHQGTPGLNATDAPKAQQWTLDTATNYGEKPKAGGDDFGWSLAFGNFDNYKSDDLAIGVPYRTGGGALTVIDGSDTELATTGNGGYRFFERKDVFGPGGPNDLFGAALG